MHKSVGLSRRKELIDSAIRLLAQGGIEALTMEELARVHKVKRANVAYYFKSRTELIEALLIEVLVEGAKYIEATFEKKVTSKPRTWDRDLDAYCEAQVSWVTHNHDQAKCLLLLYHMGSASDQFRDILWKSREKGQQRLLQILSKHSKLNDLSHAKLSLYANALHETVTGYMLYLIAFLNNESKSERRISLREQIEILLP